MLFQVTALILYGVGVLQLLQKLDFFDDILPFLIKKAKRYKYISMLNPLHPLIEQTL